MSGKSKLGGSRSQVVGKAAPHKPLPASYRADQTTEAMIEQAEREALRRLMWEMEHGATLAGRREAALAVAKLTLRRPPQVIQHEGAKGGPIQHETELVVRFVRPDNRQIVPTTSSGSAIESGDEKANTLILKG